MAAKYVLARALTPMTAQIRGSYDVFEVFENDEAPDLRLWEVVEIGWEVIEIGRDCSAAEWMRLLDKRDALREIHEVMES